MPAAGNLAIGGARPFCFAEQRYHNPAIDGFSAPSPAGVHSVVDDYSGSPGDQLGLVGPFRGQSLDRPMRLRELKDIFQSYSHAFDERIEAIEEFTNLAAGDDVEKNVQALLKLVEKPEAGLSFTLREALSTQWRLHNHVTMGLLWMHGLVAILRLSKRGEIKDQKTVLDRVLRICLNHPWGIALVRMEEDWPVDDPHRVSPYLIDPDRPQRLLLGELINQLTEGLGYDPRSHKDHERYNRISHARQILQGNELAVRNYLKQYVPKPDRPAGYAWLLNLFVPSSRKNHRGKRLAAVLQQYRDLFRRLPGRPEILFRHGPFAYDTSSAPKRLEAGPTGSSSTPPSDSRPPPDTSSTRATPTRRGSGRR